MKITLDTIEYDIVFIGDDLVCQNPKQDLVYENARQWISRAAEDDFRENFGYVRFKSQDERDRVIDSHIECYLNDELVQVAYVIRHLSEAKICQP